MGLLRMEAPLGALQLLVAMAPTASRQAHTARQVLEVAQGMAQVVVVLQELLPGATELERQEQQELQRAGTGQQARLQHGVATAARRLAGSTEEQEGQALLAARGMVGVGRVVVGMLVRTVVGLVLPVLLLALEVLPGLLLEAGLPTPQRASTELCLHHLLLLQPRLDRGQVGGGRPSRRWRGRRARGRGAGLAGWLAGIARNDSLCVCVCAAFTSLAAPLVPVIFGCCVVGCSSSSSAGARVCVPLDILPARHFHCMQEPL